MKRLILISAITFISAGIATAQDKPAPTPQPHGTQHMSHDGFMQGGMNHRMAKGVTLEAKVDQAAYKVTLRVGPMNLPAHTTHEKMPQPPDLVWEIPFEGWLLAYHPRLVDSKGRAVTGAVLHHTAFWNENRSDFLCPNKEEHIFGAGSEMTDWAEFPEFGYHVEKGDKIRIETMMYNPTATSYEKAFLEVVIPFQQINDAAPRKNVYPAWMDAGACGNSSYDLPAGETEKTGTIKLKYDGVLLGVGGHLHDYGKEVVLLDATRKETVATLEAKSDAQGHLESVPVKLFVQQGGYKLAAGDVLKITSKYDNPTGKLIRDGAMGIAVGYFVAADDTKMAALRKTPSQGHDMAGMSHDH